MHPSTAAPSMDNEYKKVERRNRPPVSCELCRARKLKCNRSLPCDSCIKRNKASACHYAANTGRSRASIAKGRGLGDRLGALEDVVSSLLYRNESGTSLIQKDDEISKGNKEQETPALTPEAPHLQESDNGQLNYVDSNHWLSILEDIKELREHLYLSDVPRLHDNPGSERHPVEHDASFLLDFDSTATFAQILASVPPRPRCDMLISWYFNARFMVLAIVHPEKFQKEYELFWESPSTAQPLWVALLLSVLNVATILHSLAFPAEVIDPSSTPRVLQLRTMQCLVLGRYATANAYALEAFLLHLQCHVLNRDSPPANPWFELGTIIRLAFRLGYHRDPSNLPRISIFDGEMRRRVWLNITQMEAMMSFMAGCPSMIPLDFCDSQDPRNLHYSDLSTDMSILPPARSLSEHTPVLYTIVKNGIMKVFKKIVAHTQSLSQPVYANTMALDAEMRKAYEQVPQAFQRRDIKHCLMDASDFIYQRCTIEILYLKSLIILHRRYLSHESQSPVFEVSRRVCAEAALNILARLADLHQACEPGGRLHNERTLFNALPIHDFLLAAIVVILDLSVRQRSGAATTHVDGEELRHKEIQALEETRRIWATMTTPETNIAVRAIDVMVNKLKESDQQFFSSRIAQPSFGLTAADTELPYAETMSQMVSGSETIDWGLFDHFFLYTDNPNTEFVN